MWGADESVFKKAGQPLELVGTWWSGQEKRVSTGINGFLLLTVRFAARIRRVLARQGQASWGALYAGETLSLTEWPVPLVLVNEPGQDPSSLLGLGTTIASPRLISGPVVDGSRPRGCVQTLTTLLAPEACQVPREDASYGHFVLRLIAFTMLVSTACCLFRDRVTREEIVVSLKFTGASSTQNTWNSQHCHGPFLWRPHKY